MIEKLYGNIPSYGKSYITENFDEINKIVKENEQLKQFKEKVFTWIDKEIARNEEAIEWGKEIGADSGAIEYYNYMLKRLRKELLE